MAWLTYRSILDLQLFLSNVGASVDDLDAVKRRALLRDEEHV
jgi:hypothetical protein